MTNKEEVNHPSRYNAGAVECIDAIESALTPEEYRGFIKGTVLRYVWREKHKGGNQDLAKAEWYTKRLLEYGKKIAVDAGQVVVEPGQLEAERAARDLSIAQDVCDWYWNQFPSIRGALKQPDLADIIARVKS